MTMGWAVLTDWSCRLLVATGLDEAAAAVVTDNLLYAERRGFTSHGFMRLPTYVDRIQAGGINRSPHVATISDQAALAIVDADNSPGAVSALRCVGIAMSKARNGGVGMVLARNANHFGAAGYYTDHMAAAGLLGIAICNTDAVMCAPFGGRSVLGTNPISIAAPMESEVGPQLDMATTEASYGRILVARDSGDRIPTGWAVDHEGAPTTDPSEALRGALLPSGGPKGVGRAFMVDCIIAIGGGETSNEVSALYGDPSVPQGLGHAFIAIAVDHAQTRSEYSARIASLTAAVHGSDTPSSFRPPMVPGEPERRRLSDTGWTVSETTLLHLKELSLALAVDVPEEVSDLSPEVRGQ